MFRREDEEDADPAELARQVATAFVQHDAADGGSVPQFDLTRQQPQPSTSFVPFKALQNRRGRSNPLGGVKMEEPVSASSGADVTAGVLTCVQLLGLPSSSARFHVSVGPLFSCVVHSPTLAHAGRRHKTSVAVR